MRRQTLACRKINSEQTDSFLVEPEHRGKAGIPYSPFRGLPVPKAFEIVNNLNRNPADVQFAYYLAEWLNG